jgi:cobalt/nickel transport system ATP-binding protein
MRPDVLLLDEPTAGLDDQATERLVEILAGLPQAMVVVSHNRPFRQRITTSTLELADGKLLPVA